SQLRQGGVGLFYYAGHGIQVRGTNYLIPIGESLDYEANNPHRTLSLNEVVALMEEAKTQVNIIIIDACRNNPWYGRWYRATISNGLAAVGTPPRGTIIAYATKPGSVAKDGIGQRNSPFTSALLQYIQIPNLDVRFM
ncbi:MAG: caspase domain-containing protein, partial [Microcystis panniformis]